jgi:hypothetical protein
LHTYDLRHFYATQLVKPRANIRTVQELLGHESVSTTQGYTALSPTALRDTVALLDDPAGTLEENGAVQPGSATNGVPLAELEAEADELWAEAKRRQEAGAQSGDLRGKHGVQIGWLNHEPTGEPPVPY